VGDSDSGIYGEVVLSSWHVADSLQPATDTCWTADAAGISPPLLSANVMKQYMIDSIHKLLIAISDTHRVASLP